MHVFEITVGKFIMPFPIFSILVIYSQEPLTVLEETILLDKLFFDLR